MKHFAPISPDPYLKKRKGDGALARFGHLNVLVDKINEFDANQTVAAGPVGSPTALVLGLNIVTPAGLDDSVILPCLSEICACSGGCGPTGPVIVKNVGLISLNVYACGTELINGGPGPVTILPGDSLTIVDSSCTSWETINSAAGSPGPPAGVQSVTGCNVDNTNPANPVIDPVLVAVVSATEALTGDGCNTPLSVCIDNVTITKDLNGCLQAVAAPPAGGDFAMFYGLTAGTGNPGPTDYAATVAAGAAVPFPQDGPTNLGGINRVGPDLFELAAIGTYEVNYKVHTTEPGQLQLEVGGAPDPSTTSANMNPTAGGHPIVGTSFITTVAINTQIRVLNPAGNSTALTITPADGANTHANAQSITIKFLG